MESIRERIKAAQDTTTEVVEVPEWDVKIEVRSMTGRERAQMMQQAFDQEAGEVIIERFYPEVVIATAFDPETGEKVFQPGDGEWLNAKNAGALERVAQVGLRLSGMDREAKERAGATFPKREK